MAAPQLRIAPFSPSISNFQKCILGSSELRELERVSGAKFFESFLSLNLPSRHARLLVRGCRSSVGDVAGLVQADLRVTQLLCSPAFSPGESSPEKREKELIFGEDEDLHFCRHLVGKMRPVVMNETGLNAEDEAEGRWSVGFNDALSCTSKDIQILKSGTIKMMRLTVLISDSPLPHSPYQANQSGAMMMMMTGGGSKKDPALSQTAAHANNWKLLREKIRAAFQAYDIHVGKRTLVDLRDCPLSSSGRRGSPPVAFVFVEEVCMKSGEGDVGRVTSKTEIVITAVHHTGYYERQLWGLISKQRESRDEETGKVYGLETAKRILVSLIEMQERGRRGLQKYFGSGDRGIVAVDNFYSHGLLIAGPSGCGKALAVREAVKNVRANLLVLRSLGQEAGVCETWTEIFIKAVESGGMYPTVLLVPKIDECLLIKQNKARSFVQKLLNHVCSLLDSIPKNCMLTVVATTDKPYLIPAKLRRAGRLEREVYIGAPTEEERLNILKSLCRKVPSFSKLDLDSVAKRTPGYVGQDLIRVAHLAVLKSYEENCSQVSDAHIKYALSRILPTVLQGSLGVVGIQRATSLDHIAGLHSVKLDLIKAIVWPLKYPHAFRTMGITPPKGILLYSPPGCAKTTLVRAVAGSHQTNFLSVSAAELFSSGVGDSEKIVADLFHRARMASPCILFIDELEAIVGSRQMSQKREKTSNESILSMLLTEMDGVGTHAQCVSDRTSQSNSKDFGPSVLVVAATNRIDLIDSALIRPGRFDKLIHVPPLDERGRLELLNICSKTIPFGDDMNLEQIAAETENYTGADLVNLCREAALFALTENMDSETVTSAHLNKAKKLLGPSLTPELLLKYKSHLG